MKKVPPALVLYFIFLTSVSLYGIPMDPKPEELQPQAEQQESSREKTSPSQGACQPLRDDSSDFPIEGLPTAQGIEGANRLTNLAPHLNSDEIASILSTCQALTKNHESNSAELIHNANNQIATLIIKIGSAVTDESNELELSEIVNKLDDLEKIRDFINSPNDFISIKQIEPENAVAPVTSASPRSDETAVPVTFPCAQGVFGFNNKAIHPEDSLCDETGYNRTITPILEKLASHLEEKNIKVENLNDLEKENLLAACKTIIELGSPRNPPPHNSPFHVPRPLDAAMWHVRTLINSLRITLPSMTEAQKLKLLFAAKCINRVAFCPEHTNGFLCPKLTTTQTAQGGSYASSAWSKSPNETRAVLQEFISNRELQIKSGPLAVAEMKTAIYILDFYLSHLPDLQTLPPLAKKIVLHYSQLRGLKKEFTNIPGYNFNPLTGQELEYNLRQLIHELQSTNPDNPDANKTDFIDFLEQLLPSRHNPLCFPSSVKSEANITPVYDGAYSFAGLKLNPRDAFPFHQKHNEAFDKATGNINASSIEEARLNNEEKSALMADLRYIINLTDASSAALPETLSGLLEYVKNRNLLSTALQNMPSLSQEQRLHLFYGMQRINRMSVNWDEGAELIAKAMRGGNGYYKFPISTNWDNDDEINENRIIPACENLLNSRTFQIKAPEQQYNKLGQIKKLLELGVEISKTIGTDKLISYDDWNTLVLAINPILHDLLNETRNPPSDTEVFLETSAANIENANQAIKTLIEKINEHRNNDANELDNNQSNTEIDLLNELLDLIRNSPSDYILK